MALAGIGKRRTSKNLTPLATRSQKKKQRDQPLFDLDSDEDPQLVQTVDDDDPTVQLVLQESLESQEEADLQRALEASRHESEAQLSTEGTSSADAGSLDVSENLASEVSDGDELNVPGRLETALAIANAGPTPKSISMTRRLSLTSFPKTSVFNAPKLLIDHPSPSSDLGEDATLEYLDEVEEVVRVAPPTVGSPATPKVVLASPGHTFLPSTGDEQPRAGFTEEQVAAVSDSDEDMEPVPLLTSDNKLSAPITIIETPKLKDRVSTSGRATTVGHVHFEDDNISTGRVNTPSLESDARPSHKPVVTPDSGQSEEERAISDWSRSPSPVADGLLATEVPISKASTVEDSWDAAQEMDPHAEEGKFARFLSQVKGKDLDDVRREIDDEIKSLNQQKKTAMRDSEDITQQMIAQIMVRLLCVSVYRILTCSRR